MYQFRNYTLGILLKVLNLLLFTGISVLALLLRPDFPTIQLLFLVSYTACLSFVPWILWTRGAYLRLSWASPGALKGASSDLAKTAAKSSDFLPGGARKSVILYVSRALFTVVGTLSWLEALKSMGGSDATALSYMIPIFTTLLAYIFCAERPNRECLIAILISFSGMYILIWPRVDTFFSSGAAVALFSALMWACHDIVCKKQTATEHYLAQSFYQFSLTLIFLLPFAISQWQDVWVQDLKYIIPMGLVSAANVTVLFLAYKFAPISILMPFSYCRLILMGVATYVLFGKILTMNSILGATVIFLASVYIFYCQYSGKLSIRINLEKEHHEMVQ